MLIKFTVSGCGLLYCVNIFGNMHLLTIYITIGLMLSEQSHNKILTASIICKKPIPQDKTELAVYLVGK